MADSPAQRGCGGPRSISRRDLLRYAGAAPVLLGLGAAATAGAPRASAAGQQLIDFTENIVAPELIKQAGYAGALVYVAESRPGANFDFKPVTREYTDGLRAAGLHVVSCYQYGKPNWPNAPSDFTRGYDGGVADAKTALRLHGAAGGPDTAPIFFSVDEGIDPDTWKKLGLQWFRGLNSVLGADRTGVYGSDRVCGWAADDGVIGHSTTAGHRWAWQTIGWSDGRREPRAVLLQVVVNTAEHPGVVLGDTHVDVDDVLAADYGQWDLAR